MNQEPISTAELLCAAAAEHLEAGAFAKAKEILDSALRLAPQSALVHYRRALYFSDTGQIEDAIASLDLSLKFEPANAKAHNNRGSALEQLGRMAEAQAAFQRALELDPSLAQPYLNLGHLLELRGAGAEAGKLYKSAIARGLDRDLFEQHLAAATGVNTRASPASWVRATFDNFASSFDERLRELRYGVPRAIADHLMTRIHAPVDILDLGCGTGQCGVELANIKRSLVGVDLSPKMLSHARMRAVYDQLHEVEAIAFAGTCAAGAFDVVVSADVFIYIGDLAEVFREVARVLKPGGWFAFSTEELDDGEFLLLPTGRYAQSERYIRGLASHDFRIDVADAAVIRTEGRTPLRGRIYLLQLHQS